MSENLEPLPETPNPHLNINALSEILSKTTSDLTDAEIDLLILGLRGERARSLSEEQAGKRKTASPLTKASKVTKGKEDITLDSLFPEGI